MRKIEQFLPPRYRTKSIRNFMNTTTNQLFSEKDASTGSYFIGNKPSGLYNHVSDYYAQEIRKIREDYQLEPTFILKDDTTGEIQSSIFYEDILNVLKSYGCSVDNHNDIFKSDTYSFSPPINVDMFINFGDYYWYPEGIPAIKVSASISDIVDYAYKVVERTVDNAPLSLSNDMIIELSDGNVYMVSGVGKSIELHEFDYSRNTSMLLNYSSNENEQDILKKHPKEYFTMERNSIDNNSWSRTNCWLHKDAITYSFSGLSFKPSNERRAERPIICFEKNIQLFNYENEFVSLIDGYTNNSTYNVDGLYLDSNIMRLVTIRSGVVENSLPIPNGRFTISSGNNVGNEYYHIDGSITELQAKYKPNLPPLFDIFDRDGDSVANELKYPNTTFSGNKIFSYDVSDLYGVYV
jgi:hypothetical protein